MSIHQKIKFNGHPAYRT